MNQYRFQVSGMSCDGCVHKINAQMADKPNIQKLNISLEHREIYIESTLSAMSLKKIIESIGFSVNSFCKES